MDLDFIPYRVGFSAERDNISIYEAYERVDKLMKYIWQKTKATQFIGYLGTSKLTFRAKLSSEFNSVDMEGAVDENSIRQYKGNRDGTNTKPLYFREVKQHLSKYYNLNLVEGIESDDACGITLAYYTKLGVVCGVVSTDKDLLQLEGMHFQFRQKGEIDFILVTNPGVISLNAKGKLVGYGDRFLWSQVLIGDPVDNYFGLPKYGPVKAMNLLANCKAEDLKTIVLNEYKKIYKEDVLAEKYFTFNYNMAYLLRELEGFSIPTLSNVIDYL